MARELHRADDERVRPAGAQADHQRVLVDATQPRERLLRRAGHGVRAQVEQHQQVAQIGPEEGHLVGPRDQDLLRGRDRLDRRRDVGARRLARRLLHVEVVGRDRGLELALVEGEQRLDDRRRPRPARGRRALVASAVLLARGALQLREALEAERLGEAHDRRARGVRAARELLGGLEGDLVEMVDDVLRHILLGAREFVEARLDVGAQGLVTVGLVWRRRGGKGGGGGPLHGHAGLSTRCADVPPNPVTWTSERLRRTRPQAPTAGSTRC